MNRAEDRPDRKRRETNRSGWAMGRLGLIIVMLCLSLISGVSAGEPDNEPKSVRKTCGTCPEGSVYFYTELWPDGKLTLTSQDETPSPVASATGPCGPRHFPGTR